MRRERLKLSINTKDYFQSLRLQIITRLEAVEFATLEWVDWYDHRWLLEPIGNMPPAEREALYYEQQGQARKAA